MKIVVTGALGHIGSRLIRALPDAFPGAEIVMIDNLATQRYASLFDLPAHGKYRFLEADVMTADLAGVFAGSSVVIHLAAITNAAGSFANRDQVELVNHHGTERVALACATTGAKLVYLSSTSVYGTQNEVVAEDCSADELKPQSPYAEAKLSGEVLLQQMGANHGLRFISCRFGTIFGISPGMRFHTAVNKFCWQAVMGDPISVWRTALNQVRPYLELGDAIEAMLHIVRTALFDNRVYNILTCNSSVAAIADIIRRLVPDLAIEYVDNQIMNQLSYDVSNQRSLAAGFSYRGSLEQGIEDTIKILEGARSWRN